MEINQRKEVLTWLIRAGQSCFGEQPSASKWNILGANDASFNDGTGIANLANNVTAFSNPYKFSVYRNSAWTSAGSSYGKVTFDTEVFDTNNNFASGAYIAPVAGFYHFSAGVQANAAAGALAGNAIYVNDAQIHVVEIENGANTTPIGPNISALVQLAANDEVEIYHYGSGSTGSTGKDEAWFTGYLVCNT